MPRGIVAEDEPLLREELLAVLREGWPELEIGRASCRERV